MEIPSPSEETVQKSTYTLPSSAGFEGVFHKAEEIAGHRRSISFDSDKQRNARNLSKGLSKPGYIPFETLRRASKSVHIASICKTVMKEKITKTKWIVSPNDPMVDASKLKNKIEKINHLLKKPNVQGDTWRSFIDKSVEDLLVLDSVFWEKTRFPDGELAELYHVDASTIHPVFNEHGQTNVGLELETKDGVQELPVAYLQVLNYSQYGGPESGDIVAAWPKDEAMLFHLHPQGSLDGFGYGMSPLESVLSVLIGIMNADNYNATYFEEGGFPPVILQLVGQMTERDLERYREYLLSELQGHFHRPAVIAGEKEAKAINLKDLTNRDMQFMEYMIFEAKLMCAAHGMMPQDIGLTDSIGGKNVSETQKDISQGTGYGSILDLLEEQINIIIEEDFGYDDIHFEWVADDTMKETEISTVVDQRLKNGSMTINEAREKFGDIPFEAWANEPTLLTADGFQKIGADQILDPVEVREENQEMQEKSLEAKKGTNDDEKKPFGKSTMDPLYVQRKVLNAPDIIEWAKSQGFKTTLSPDDMHVTLAYSRVPIDWVTAYDDMSAPIRVVGGERKVEILGDKGAVVLRFDCDELFDRWQSFMDVGASWDYEGYHPHITLTYDIGDVDLENLESYDGPIVLGEELFSVLDENWSDGIKEKTRTQKSVYTEHYRCFFDDRGYSQPFIYADLVTGQGFVVKPPVAVNLMSQQLEVNLSKEIEAEGINVPPVRKMSAADVMAAMPIEVKTQFDRYVTMMPEYDSEKWRAKIGGSRRFPYYLVQPFLDGYQLADPRLIDDMKRDPESYKQAIEDLAEIWKVEKKMKLGDRRKDQYLITMDKRGWGFDYQFKGDVVRWERTKDSLPDVIKQIPELWEIFNKKAGVRKSAIQKLLERAKNVL
jgi:hypothetical protein